MRDLHFLSGPKRHVDSLESGLKLVRETWPLAMMDSSIGAASFSSASFSSGARSGREVLVGEAWVCARKGGWWIRVKKKASEEKRMIRLHITMTGTIEVPETVYTHEGCTVQPLPSMEEIARIETKAADGDPFSYIASMENATVEIRAEKVKKKPKK